jgi:TolB-like protein
MDDDRLDGWKAIGNFLGRDRTTALRWARERRLPVHRVPGGRTGTVYALRVELNEWLASGGGTAPVEAPRSEIAIPMHPQRRRTWLIAPALALVAASVGFIALRQPEPDDAPVTIAAVASPGDDPATRQFTRELTSDLARYANRSAGVAVYETERVDDRPTRYAVRTLIERGRTGLIAHARLVAMHEGQVIWSRRFDQSGRTPSALRERVAANIMGILRCGFGGLESDRLKVTPADVALIMASCQAVQDTDHAAAQFRAREVTRARPDLAIGWASLAIAQGTLAAYENKPAMRVQAIANAQRAVQIAPDHAITRLALAAAADGGLNNPNAFPILSDALRVHPNDPSLLMSYSVTLFNMGYVQASVAPALRATEVDGTSMNCRDTVVRRLAVAGRTEEALAYQGENERLWPGHPQIANTRARLTTPWGTAADTPQQAIRNYGREVAQEPYAAFMLARIHERSGDRRSALDWLARAKAENAHQQWSLLFWPDARGLRSEPAFFRKMGELGLVKWWVARKQWPDFCAEPGLKYDCATEAAKLGFKT